MPTVAELTALYSNFMLGPRPGPGVCERCFNLTDGYAQRFACHHGEDPLDAMAAISYSVAHEQLHHALAAYKRAPQPVAERFQLELAAVLWRYLALHERCLARAAGVERFALITTVPSGDRSRDHLHPLPRILSELTEPARSRYRRLLERSGRPVAPRALDPMKFTATAPLDGSSVLLIDDTWTTGASAQSATIALKAAGAGRVAALVIGRHVNRDWGRNDEHLKALATPFDWRRCAVGAPRDPAARATGPETDPDAYVHQASSTRRQLPHAI